MNRLVSTRVRRLIEFINTMLLMVLSKLDFPLEESLDPKSQATKYVDELAKNESNVETIIEKLVAYKDERINS
ncbi:hypothetical protein [Peribacillus simplex]|uniref:hypothetical protein n=1 Tax=Peribacillus simplex TaxID=1478 RepID=UPI0011A8B519|nr:hypothetical protein [Peribacillus simplex]